MLKELNWETVEESRIKSRIRTLHKIITNQLAINGQKYFKDKPQRKRRGHDRQLVLHETPYSTVMKDSFFALLVWKDGAHCSELLSRKVGFITVFTWNYLMNFI